ncbi:nuclear transport factor 2 family protein [Leifsonia poae]|uniref:Polyketide cyclase n=1 Tax=Leifsonia poae TaxID=110933 RepID=A0A9W6H868_9MICO|nr:nuclear transport factor 2 family protein [Leifsonia poae]GLJ75756.1 hypothetical protein GCM10017584_13300 [Leifsonia poae]
MDQSPDAVPPIVAAAIAAANAHDTDAFLDAFAPGGAVDDWGRVFTGPEAIRGWSDREFIGVDVTLGDLRGDPVDGGVAVTAQVGGRGFNGPSTFTFLVGDAGIERMTITA